MNVVKKESAAAEIEERTRKLQQYREMLIADGIDPNELLNSMAAAKTGTKAKRAAVLLNIATLMRTAKLKPGLARVVLLLLSRKHG
jgi:DNA-binding protein H-NS